MYTLGIETSCDETSVAVVENGKRILANEVISSLKYHTRYGGVIPEIASRMQLEVIAAVAENALRKARVRLKEIGLISVTNGPGLIGSLIVGITFAKSLALVLNKPMIGVNHVLSHMYAHFLVSEAIRRPFIALVVSGGHTSLFYVREFHKIQLMGQTQDDACGEAFDKVAKLLGLPYPGGPQIEALALRGNPRKIRFRCSGTKGELDFSFSGIKTAVLYYLRDHARHSTHGTRHTTHDTRLTTLDSRLKYDIAASFQETVVDTLIEKSLRACQSRQIRHLVVGGGVALNNRLREKMAESARQRNVICHFPRKDLCMDNAAMVAGYGYQLYKQGIRSDLHMDIG